LRGLASKLSAPPNIAKTMLPATALVHEAYLRLVNQRIALGKPRAFFRRGGKRDDAAGSR